MSENKNEKPTPKKIEDARKKGQVAVSRDAARLCTLVVVAELAFMGERIWREAVQSLFDTGIGGIGHPFAASAWRMAGNATTVLVLIFLLLFVVGAIVAFASHWGQFGVLFAPEALVPKPEKLSPVNGAKELFSKKKLSELLLTVLKSLLIGTALYLLVRDALPSIVGLAGGTPKDVHFGFFEILRNIFHLVVVLCFLIAIGDLAIQNHFHTKSLMMDMEEIKREYKEMEGDPLIKGARRMLAREFAEGDPVERTEDANAVVVNPTHFAVAMYYNAAEVPVPIVLAKGKDEVAQAMIRRARQRGIPVIRHVWLARTLYATARNDAVVPKSSYGAVAHVYAIVHELQTMGQQGAEVELESFGEPPGVAPGTAEQKGES